MDILLGITIFLGLYIWEEKDQLVKTFREAMDGNPCGVNKSHSLESRFVGLTYNEDGSVKMDGPLYVFDTFANGLKNAALVLKYVTMGGYKARTLNDIAYHWTGRTVEQGSYDGASMAGKLDGYTADQELDFDADGANILYALVACENNDALADFIPWSNYQDAVLWAGGQ